MKTIMLSTMVVTVILLISLNSCRLESKGSPGIETDKDLGKNLFELSKDNPQIISRNPKILSSDFTFHNKCFKDEDDNKIILNSIDFNSTDKEKVLIKFTPKKLDIVVEKLPNKYTSTDHILFIDKGTIEIIEKYTEKVLFKGDECVINKR